MKKIKNNKINADTWCGMEIQPNIYYEIQSTELSLWQNNSKVLVDIACGDLVVNDGVNDIVDVALAINYIKEIEITQVDTDGRQIIRAAAGKPGWTYLAHPVEFQTSKINSLFEKNSLNVSRGISSLKFYDIDNIEVTNSENETSIVKTVLLFKPGYDFELIAGSIQQIQAPTSDLRIWVVGGMIEIGGPYVKEFCGGVNMIYFGDNESLKTDGRAAKYMKKDTAGAPYQTNQLQAVVRHEAGYQHKLMLVFEYFRA
jgi:hypothetical protein